MPSNVPSSSEEENEYDEEDNDNDNVTIANDENVDIEVGNDNSATANEEIENDIDNVVIENEDDEVGIDNVSIANEENNETVQNIENNESVEHVGAGITNEENNESVNNTENVENVEHVGAGIEAKPMLITAQLNESDIMAFNELIDEGNLYGVSEVVEQNISFNGSNEIVNGKETTSTDNVENVDLNSNSLSLIAQENIGHDTAEEPDNATENAIAMKQVTETIDEEVEMTFTVGQKFLPSVQTTPMIPKANDTLTGNMPYQAILNHQDVSIYGKN